jgi:hypothetical protein
LPLRDPFQNLVARYIALDREHEFGSRHSRKIGGLSLPTGTLMSIGEDRRKKA